MKKIFTILTFLSVTSIFATDRFVDPNLSAGNGTTLFTNITSAVAAADNGDRIIVSSNTYNEAALTISKSLKIIPQTASTTINFNANIIIAGFPGMKLEILGFNLGVYSFSSVSSGNLTDKAKVSIIQCSAVNLDLNLTGFELNSIRNTISNQITYKNGSIILNNVGTIYISDDGLNNPSISDKNLIVANTINSLLYVYNNDNKFIIANNTIGGSLIIKRWNANSAIKNKIINNQFNNLQILVSAYNVPNYNLIFSNNTGNVTFYNNNDTSNPFDEQHLDYNSQNAEDIILYYNYYGSTGNSARFPNNDVGGIFEWSYNNILLNHPATSGGQPLSFINTPYPVPGNIIIDAGNPNHDYYDLDLTINDRGINGGPYSILNYNPTSNPNNSKAFIFDLDIPTDLFPGQNVNISAKGYHKN